MFKKLEHAKRKLKPSKCKLFHQQITYVGYIVSTQGTATNGKKTEVIEKWPTRPPLPKSGYFWDLQDITASLPQVHPDCLAFT